MKQNRLDTHIIGFALFSMFFGAGNVVFPPFLGLESGPQWLLGFLCYFVADIGLALMALFAMLRNDGIDGVLGRIGKIPSEILMCAIVLCIGPMVAIPRTAATTFEMSIAPLFPSLSSLPFSILFFAVILILSIKESAVVDIVGKFLTPALMIGLLILIAKGVFWPLGTVEAIPRVDNVPATGIKSGYQTMDVLAALVFGILILESAESKGYRDSKSKFKVVAGAGIVAGVLLLVVYMGLTYLGASSAELFGGGISRSVLIVSIVKLLLGRAGVVIFAVVVALACITTALSLVSSAASYFSRLLNGKISYKALVVIICVFSTVVSDFGLDMIISIAGPILDVIYPPALVLIILSFFGSKIKGNLVFRFSVAGALIMSILSTFSSYGKNMPLAELGFGWAIPAVICGLIGFAVDKLLGSHTKNQNG